MKKKIRCLVLTYILTLIIFPSIIKGAAANKVEMAKESIVRVESVCRDGDSVVYDKRSFSGFLVRGNSSDVYVITVSDHLNYSPQEIAAIHQSNGLEDKIKLSVGLEIVLQGDLRVSATLVNNSAQRNISVLRLDQSIVLEHIPEFAPEEVEDGDKLILLSFPESGPAMFNTENVKVMKGRITGSDQKEDFRILFHDIASPRGSEGGLLLNNAGLIAGMLLTPAAGESDKGTAIGSEEIRTILDLYGIDYPVFQEVRTERFTKIHFILGIGISAILLYLFRQLLRKMFFKLSEYYKSRKEAAGGRAQLLLLDSQKTVPITKKMFTVGTEKNLNLVYGKGTGVSRKHALIIREKKKYFLVDLHSTNKTYLNGKVLVPDQKFELKDKDQIAFAAEQAIFRVR